MEDKCEVKRIHLQAFGKEGTVKAYKAHGKLICQEASLLDFAFKVGLKNFQVKSVQVAEDILWNSRGEIMSTPEQTTIKDRKGNTVKEKNSIIFLKGLRYTVLYQVTTPDGGLIVDLGSAGADSCNLEFRRYAPEIASRRARVRTILTAINRKDLSVDIEMPPDFIREDKKQIERNRDGKCRPEQIEALGNIYNSKAKIQKLLEKYNREKIEDLTRKEASRAIREGQKRKLPIG